MGKFRVVFVLAAAVCVCAMSASSASAWFKSSNGTSEGNSKDGATVFTVSGGVIKAAGGTDVWKIREKEGKPFGTQGETQPAATEGPHQLLHQTYKEITAEIAGVTVKSDTET